MSRGKTVKNGNEEVKVYRPGKDIVPEWETNVIVDNYTDDKGRVFNRSEENVLLSKKETDANHK